MNKKYILSVATTSLLMVSCADEFNPAYTSVEIPVDLAKIEELSGFAPLKENIKRADHPGFKLGAALDASEFNKLLTVYNVGVTNFDEVVAGNAMKYASCVDGKGNMDFSTVSDFVNKADEAGISVYGHTLVWHSQQQPQYLNGLIADKPMPKPEGTMVDVEVPDYTIDWTSQSAYNMWGAGGATAIDGGLKITNSKIQNFWECQYQVASGVPTVTGSDYVIKVVLKAQGDGDEVNLHYKLGNWDGGIEGSTTITANGEWQEFTKKGTATCDGSFFLIQFGDYIGDVTVKEVTVSHIEQQMQQATIIVDVPDYTIDWTSQSAYNMWGAGGATAIDGGLKITNSKIQNFWECQYQVASGVPTVKDSEYTIHVVLKAQGDGDEVNLHYKLGNWDGGIEGSTTITANGEWQEFSKTGVATCDGSFFLIQFGDYIGDVTVKEITVSHKEEQAAPTIKDVEDYAIDWTSQSAYNMWGAGGATAIDGGLKITNSKIQNFWECQYQVASGVPTVKDGEYKFKVVLKAEGDGDEVNLHYKLGNWDGGIEGSTTITANGEWQEFSKKGTATCDGSFLLVQFGDYIGSVTIKEVVVSHEEEVQGGAQEVEKTFTEKKPTLVVTSQDMAANPWDTQFWILTDGWDAGSSYEFSAKIRADIKADASSQCHGEPGAYISGSGVGTLKFTQDWDTYSSKGTLNDAGKSIAFNLNDQAKGTKYYFRDLSFKVNGVEMLKNGDLSGTDVSSFIAKEYPSTSTTTNAKLVQEITYSKMVASNTIPLTKEEKDSILSVALDKWIAGMMDACGGKVKAWDLANELICNGEQRVDGRYALQHGQEDDDQNFFWQDYLGDEKVVQFAVASARQHYAESMEEQGGDDGQLKLFINDYNLEADYDENAKLASLIKWIEIWESDGVTKIDGIGSQMHISYYENSDKLERQKKFIRKSFEMMAATKKLVRISELDMGYYDANGKKLGWAEISSADQAKAGYPMEKAMADYYQWIIETYFEVVPKEQQYGITQWCLTDATGEVGQTGGWRPGEPVGIWDLNWNRKYVYRGWVNALQK